MHYLAQVKLVHTNDLHLGNWHPSNSKGHGQPSPFQPEGVQSTQPVNTVSMPHTRLHAKWDFHGDVMNNITLYALCECVSRNVRMELKSTVPGSYLCITRDVYLVVSWSQWKESKQESESDESLALEDLGSSRKGGTQAFI